MPRCHIAPTVDEGSAMCHFALPKPRLCFSLESEVPPTIGTPLLLQNSSKATQGNLIPCSEAREVKTIALQEEINPANWASSR